MVQLHAGRAAAAPSAVADQRLPHSTCFRVYTGLNSGAHVVQLRAARAAATPPAVADQRLPRGVCFRVYTRV